MFLIGLGDWTWLRKESLSLLSYYKSTKLKSKDKNRKKKTEYTRTVEQLQNIKYTYRKYQKRREGKKTHK